MSTVRDALKNLPPREAEYVEKKDDMDQEIIE